MRIAIIICGYVVIFFVLANVWDRFLYFQYEYVWQPPMIEKIIVPGILFPLILGFICAINLKIQNVIDYWPLAVAPFFVTTIRVIVDDLSPPWFFQNSGWLIIGTISSMLFSVLGAWVYIKWMKSRSATW